MNRPSDAAIAIPDDAEMDRCERLLTDCTCIPDYKNRDLTDPQCEACNLGSEIVDTFRAMRANLSRAIDAEAKDVTGKSKRYIMGELRIRKDNLHDIWYVQKKTWDYKTQWVIIERFNKLSEAVQYTKDHNNGTL